MEKTGYRPGSALTTPGQQWCGDVIASRWTSLMVMLQRWLYLPSRTKSRRCTRKCTVCLFSLLTIIIIVEHYLEM